MRRLLSPAVAFWLCNAIALALVVLALWRIFHGPGASSLTAPWIPLISWLLFTAIATFCLHETAQSMVMELSSRLGIQAFTPLFAGLLVLFLPGLIIFGLYHWGRFAYQQHCLQRDHNG